MCSDCGLNLQSILAVTSFWADGSTARATPRHNVKPPEGYDVVAVYPNAQGGTRLGRSRNSRIPRLCFF